MKKLLITMLLLAGTATIGTSSFASYCKNVDFENSKVCVNIEKVSGTTFKLTTNTSSNGLRCGISLISKKYNKGLLIRSMDCNGGTFKVPGLDIEETRIYITKDGKAPRSNFPEGYYNFNTQEWVDGYGDNSNNNDDSSNNLSKFNISLPSNPSVNSEVKLSIKAQDRDSYTIDNYNGSNAKIDIAYRTNSSSSWSTTTNSTYYSIDSSNPRFSNGLASTYITFKRNYDYRITVTDSDSDISTIKYVYIDGSSSNSSSSDLNKFNISLPTPSVNSEVKLSIKAQDRDSYTIDNYNGSNAKIDIAYRTSSSSSWSTTTSSSYYSIDSSNPRFSNGLASTYITFKKNYDYRITVSDSDANISTIKYVYMNGSSNDNSSSSSLNKFNISLSNSNPSTNSEVKLSLKAEDRNSYTIDNYNSSNAKIDIAYRTNSSSSWSTTTSSTYYSMDSSTPRFSNGSAYTYITFKRNYDYRITVTDSDANVSTIKYVYMNGSSNDNSSSSSYGFTSSQVNAIENLYNIRDSNINNLKTSSSKLKKDTYRINMSSDFKAEMKKIINNTSNKKYNNYDEFENAFSKRFSYTNSNK